MTAVIYRCATASLNKRCVRAVLMMDACHWPVCGGEEVDDTPLALDWSTTRQVTYELSIGHESLWKGTLHSSVDIYIQGILKTPLSKATYIQYICLKNEEQKYISLSVQEGCS